MGKKKVFQTLRRPLSACMVFLLVFSWIPSVTPVHAAGDGAAELTLTTDVSDAVFGNETSPSAADSEADPVTAGDTAPAETLESAHYSCESDDGISVSAVASSESGIPADAELRVKKADTESDAYRQAYDAVRDALKLSEDDDLYFTPYDIHFEAVDGTKIEPENGSVEVAMQFASDPFASVDVETPSDAEKFAVHVRDDGSAERIKAEFAEDNTVTFTVSSFSEMGPAMVVHNAEETALDGDDTEIYVPEAPESAEGVDGTVSKETIEEALQYLKDNKGDNKGIITLTDDVAMDDAARLSGVKAVIRSYGDTVHVLTRKEDSESENMFVLTDGAALTLENVVVDATANTQGRTIVASGGSTLTLGTGAVLKDNTSYGAVYLDGSSIHLDGGNIQNNSAGGSAGKKEYQPSGTWGNVSTRYVFDEKNLAGKQGLGGAVLMTNGSTFAMTSGEISENTALCGGAVYAWKPDSITLDGGKVSRNTANGTEYNATGGAFCIDGSGCKVAAKGTEVSGNSAKQGGAFYFGIDAGTIDLIMTAGQFTKNEATDGSVIYSVAADGVIDISGSSSVIENNTATGNGGIYQGMYPGNPKSERAKIFIHDGATFTQNKAAKGSCIYATRDGGIKSLEMNGAVIKENETTNDAGVMQYNVPDSDFAIRNCEFTDNRAENRGGCFYASIDAKGTKFTFENSTFTGNSARVEGGVWRGYTPESTVLVKDCKFENNSCGFEKGGSDVPDQKSGGGCFYFPGDGTNANVTFDGGVFRENKSGASGGAFMIRLNGGTVTVKGGTLFEKNEADVNAGAFSIRRKGEGYYGKAYLLDCDVIENVCNADFSHYADADIEPTKHYNTGGVYVAENVTLYMYDALVTGNYVEEGYTGNKVGSGIGLCPNAQVYLYPNHGAMVYGNGNGKDEKTMDILAVPYDETINHETPAKLYVSDVTPDGRDYNWTNLDNGDARTGMYDWTNIRNSKESGVMTASLLDDPGEDNLDPVGFKAHVADAGIKPMDTSGGDDYKVRIIGNYTREATYAAGGVMVNGTVIAGDFEVNVKKEVEVEGKGATEETKNELQKKKIYEFQFSIIDAESRDDADNSSLKKPTTLVNCYSGTSVQPLTFERDKITLNGDEEGYGDLEAGEYARLYCTFTITGSETARFDKINTDNIGINDDHDYRFLLEETRDGGADSVVISSEAKDSGGNLLDGPFDKLNKWSGNDISTFYFTVTNTFRFGELDLTKNLEGPSPDQGKLWTFHVELKRDGEGLSGTYPVELWENGKQVTDTVEQGGLTFTNGIEDLTFESGKADVQLKGGQTLKIRDLPVGVEYTVTEDSADNYETTKTDNTGKTSTEVSEVAFTNTRKTGALSVSKKVVNGPGGEMNRTWGFDIALTDDKTPVNGEFNYTGTVTKQAGDSIDETRGTITFEGGKATVYLKHDQTITITGLPAGASYTVTEPDADKGFYDTTAENDEGEIKAGEEAEATFTNTHKTGNLSVTKTVSGELGDTKKDWNFTVTLSDDTINGTYGGMTFTNGVAEFTLKHDETVTASGLPAGIEYTVTEKEANADEYLTTSGNVNGTIPADSTANANFNNEKPAPPVGSLTITKKIVGGGADAEGKTFTFTVTGPNNYSHTFDITGAGSMTLDKLPVGDYKVTEERTALEGYTLTVTGEGTATVKDGDNVNVTVTNTYTSTTGNLTVKKTVTGEGDKTKNFNFTVTLGDTSISGTYGDMTFTNGVAEFTLKHGESKRATGLPADITYTVTETEADKDGYNTTVEDNDSTETDGKGTIEAEGDDTVEFINDKPTTPPPPQEKTGNLTVKKTVTGEGDKTKNFNFTVTLGDTSISGTYGDMTFTNGVAEFTLKHGESKTATGLPAGITYTVTETEANADGYNTTVEDNDSTKTDGKGTIEAEGDDTVKFTNDKPTTPPPPQEKTGNLTVKKTVTGEGDKTKEWHFRVELSDKSIKGKYGEMTFSEGVAEFTLKHGESFTAKNLPKGVTYTVTETEANQDGYETSSTGGSGTIPDGGTATAEFVNDKGDKPHEPDNPPDNPSVNPPDNPSKNSPDSIAKNRAEHSSDSPKTGDTSHIIFWLTFMLLSLICAFVASVQRMRRQQNVHRRNRRRKR